MWTSILLTTLLGCVSAWDLETTHESIIPRLSSDVTLKCSDTDNSGGRPYMNRAQRIRILKHNEDDEWETFAMRSSSDSSSFIVQSVSPFVTVTSDIGHRRNSFLSIAWTTAQEDTAGVYKCEVIGIGVKDEMKIAKTENVSISAVPASVNDLFKLFLNIKDEEETMQETLENDTKPLQANHLRLTAEFEAMRSKHNQDYATRRDELKSLQGNFTEEINSNLWEQLRENYYEARHWPMEPFALPASSDGCPLDSTDELEQVYIQLSNYVLSPRAATPNHFMKPLSQGGYFYMRFCQRRSTTSSGVVWPKGSYCIYLASTRICPERFTQNYFKTDSTNNRYYKLISVGGSTHHPYYQSSPTHFYAYFCCRNDGSPDTPISLPTYKPFYLYRYKGKCQAVYNMNATNEWMEISTSTNGRYSKSYSNSLIHPDGNANTGRLELCYYQRHVKK